MDDMHDIIVAPQRSKNKPPVHYRRIPVSDPRLVRILHEAVTRARTDPDLILKDLADFAGVTLMTLNRWIRGESVPRPPVSYTHLTLPTKRIV